MSKSSNGWVRHGECRPNCGACCLVLMQDLEVRVNTPLQDPAYWKARGLTDHGDGSVTARGTLLAPCPQLTTDVRCALQSSGKPQWCQDYPTAPEQITEMPCSYWFTNDAGERWGGQASPYPTRTEVPREQ